MRAGQRQIEQPGEQGCDRRDMFDRPAQGHMLRKRQQAAAQRKRQAHDDADMQSRHCQQMRQPAGLKRRAVAGRDCGGHAGQQRRRDGTVHAGQRRQDARGDGGPDTFPFRVDARVLAAVEPCCWPDGEAITAETAEIRVPLRVPAAGIAGWGRRPQQRPDADPVTRAQRRVVTAAQPDPDAAVQNRSAIQRHIPKRHAAAVRQDIQVGDLSPDEAGPSRQLHPGGGH